MAVGGAIIEITYNHPTLGTGAIYPMADEDATIDLGGYRTEDDDKGVDGSGEIVKVMSQTRWSVEITTSNDMNVRKDQEKITALAANPSDADWTFTHINGTVYGGRGAIVGDVKASSKATMSFKVQGSGILKQL